MTVCIDGMIYELQSNGGISRIFNEVLPRICHLDPFLEMTLVTFGLDAHRLPDHDRLRHYAFPGFLRAGSGLPGKVVRKLARTYFLPKSDDTSQIWHTSYYTEPSVWKGPIIQTVADMIHERFRESFSGRTNALFRERKRRCLERADVIFSISQATKEDILRFHRIDPDKIKVIHLGKSEVFRPLDGEPLSIQLPTVKPFLLYIGTRVQYKNFKGFVTAYSRWLQRNEVDIIVVGPDWTSEETGFLQQHNVLTNVHRMGHVSDERLCELYNRAAAFVYPSLYEGFGIPLLEAMACGCPTVASRIPSTVEIAGEHPVYFDPVPTDEFVSALDQAVTEGRESRRTLEGLQWSKSYTWTKTASGILDVYHNLL